MALSRFPLPTVLPTEPAAPLSQRVTTRVSPCPTDLRLLPHRRSHSEGLRLACCTDEPSGVAPRVRRYYSHCSTGAGAHVERVCYRSPSVSCNPVHYHSPDTPSWVADFCDYCRGQRGVPSCTPLPPGCVTTTTTTTVEPPPPAAVRPAVRSASMPLRALPPVTTTTRTYYRKPAAPEPPFCCAPAPPLPSKCSLPPPTTTTTTYYRRMPTPLTSVAAPEASAVPAQKNPNWIGCVPLCCPPPVPCCTTPLPAPAPAPCPPLIPMAPSSPVPLSLPLPCIAPEPCVVPVTPCNAAAQNQSTLQMFSPAHGWTNYAPTTSTEHPSAAITTTTTTTTTTLPPGVHSPVAARWAEGLPSAAAQALPLQPLTPLPVSLPVNAGTAATTATAATFPPPLADGGLAGAVTPGGFGSAGSASTAPSFGVVTTSQGVAPAMASPSFSWAAPVTSFVAPAPLPLLSQPFPGSGLGSGATPGPLGVSSGASPGTSGCVTTTAQGAVPAPAFSPSWGTNAAAVVTPSIGPQPLAVQVPPAAQLSPADGTPPAMGSSSPAPAVAPNVNASTASVSFDRAGSSGMGLLLKSIRSGSPTGLQVKHVAPGSQAERAGIQVGDIILRVNDIDILTQAQFRTLIRSRRAVTLQIYDIRNGAKKTRQLWL